MLATQPEEISPALGEPGGPLPSLRAPLSACVAPVPPFVVVTAARRVGQVGHIRAKRRRVGLISQPARRLPSEPQSAETEPAATHSDQRTKGDRMRAALVALCGACAVHGLRSPSVLQPRLRPAISSRASLPIMAEVRQKKLNVVIAIGTGGRARTIMPRLPSRGRARTIMPCLPSRAASLTRKRHSALVRRPR